MIKTFLSENMLFGFQQKKLVLKFLLGFVPFKLLSFTSSLKLRVMFCKNIILSKSCHKLIRGQIHKIEFSIGIMP